MAIREISDAPLGNERQIRVAVQDLMKKVNQVIKDHNRLSEAAEGAITVLDWAAIQNTPTTLAGYGIVDAAKKFHKHHWSDILDPPAFSSGDPGPPGPAGPAGGPGSPGPAGAAGPQGLPGRDGMAGPPGSDGAPGADGGLGPKGDKGVAGAAGPPGLMGPPGVDGRDGSEGRAGPQGLAGTPGAAGPVGPKGLQGPPGMDGIGLVGPQGPPGVKGDKGDRGFQGMPGIDGLPGPQGDRGPPGPQGATGAGGGAGLVLSIAEIVLVASPSCRRSGHAQITGLAGLTVGKPVLVQQAAGPYTGKGTRADEAEMDSIIVTGKVKDAATIDLYWSSRTKVRGNFKFQYMVSA